MARIDIRHPHHRSLESARQAVDQTAESIRGKFGVSSHWQGDTLVFERPGIAGEIRVDAQDIHIIVQLGLLFGTMKPLIEKEIRQHLDKVLKA